MLFDPNKWTHVETSTEEPKPLEPWRQLLLDAADLIEAKGWIQRRSSSENGYCMVGAIASTSYYSKRYQIADVALAHLTAHLYAQRQYPVLWNDRAGRTKEEVLALMREVARS